MFVSTFEWVCEAVRTEARRFVVLETNLAAGRFRAIRTRSTQQPQPLRFHVELEIGGLAEDLAVAKEPHLAIGPASCE